MQDSTDVFSGWNVTSKVRLRYLEVKIHQVRYKWDTTNIFRAYRPEKWGKAEVFRVYKLRSEVRLIYLEVKIQQLSCVGKCKCDKQQGRAGVFRG